MSPKEPKTSLCERCGSKYVKKRYWQRSCSRKCQIEAYHLKKANEYRKIKAISFLLALFFLFPLSAYSETPDNSLAVKAIIGEADGEGYETMYAVACAIRNRGTLTGVYGLHAKRRESAQVWQAASRAWFLSEDGPDITKGATHFLSDYDLAHARPQRIAFKNKMVETAVIGRTHFYKEVL